MHFPPEASWSCRSSNMGFLCKCKRMQRQSCENTLIWRCQGLEIHNLEAHSYKALSRSRGKQAGPQGTCLTAPWFTMERYCCKQDRARTGWLRLLYINFCCIQATMAGWAAWSWLRGCSVACWQCCWGSCCSSCFGREACGHRRRLTMPGRRPGSRKSKVGFLLLSTTFFATATGLDLQPIHLVQEYCVISQ